MYTDKGRMATIVKVCFSYQRAFLDETASARARADADRTEKALKARPKCFRTGSRGVTTSLGSLRHRQDRRYAARFRGSRWVSFVSNTPLVHNFYKMTWSVCLRRCT